MKEVVPLAKAHETAVFGSKAVGLGQAMRDGLPVPPGIALAGPVVAAVAGGDARAIKKVNKLAGPLRGPLAVRSSAVDEDGADASFAGQHLTLLNVPSVAELTAAPPCTVMTALPALEAAVNNPVDEKTPLVEAMTPAVAGMTLQVKAGDATATPNWS